MILKKACMFDEFFRKNHHAGNAYRYFCDFAYCDSSMIPWLLASELLCTTQKSIVSLVEERIGAFLSSG